MKIDAIVGLKVLLMQGPNVLTIISKTGQVFAPDIFRKATTQKPESFFLKNSATPSVFDSQPVDGTF